ncbi:hypothetical protein CVT26_001068 [Gymnopilus dilepis]|uniref:Uncharacterized protein n=1 Tax=Gymnopilus dilepis TaxID=231916 RepID=A0A409WBL6_9AGAR|nr:hypothetical protein CVT26_001068 [Gymnopilus dilepis]
MSAGNLGNCPNPVPVTVVEFVFPTGVEESLALLLEEPEAPAGVAVVAEVEAELTVVVGPEPESEKVEGRGILCGPFLGFLALGPASCPSLSLPSLPRPPSRGRPNSALAGRNIVRDS